MENENRDSIAVDAVVSQPKEYWDGLVEKVNNTMKILKHKPTEFKIGYQISPRGILNAYREGDLNFEEATKLIEELITG